MLDEKISTVKEKAGAIFDYIADLARLGRPIVDDFATHAHWCKYHCELWNGDNLLPGVQFNKSADDLNVWISLSRLNPTPPPKLPIQAALMRWKGEIKIPDFIKEPKAPSERVEKFASREEVNELLESGILDNEHISAPSEDGAVHCRFLWSNDKDAQSAWKKYMQEQWHPWQKKEKPIREQCQIYREFHDISKASGIDDFPLEVVFGVGLAQESRDNKTINNPVIEQIAEIKLIDQTGEILIYPRSERSPMVSLASFQKHPSIGNVKKCLAKCIAQEGYELNIFDINTFSPIVAVAHTWLDPGAQKAEKYHPGEKPERLTLYSDWAVFIRRRDDSFIIGNVAQAMKEQIADEKEINKLPRTIVNIMGITDDTEKPDNGTSPPPLPQRPVPSSGMSSKMSRRYLPLAYNKDQERVIDALTAPDCDGIVVQGPPGTGKSHTIANIICHYLATGKRVLVSSHDIAALNVLEGKIPENIRGLTIPVLDSTHESKAKTEKAINQLLAIQAIHNDVIEDSISRGEREEAMARKTMAQTETDLKLLFDRQTEKPGAFLKGFLDSSQQEHPTALLAQWVSASADIYGWFSDRPNTQEWNALSFDDDEIVQLRDARIRLGDDLRHLGKTFPTALPPSQLVRDWHNNLRQAAQMEKQMSDGEIRRFIRTTDDVVKQAGEVEEKLQTIAEGLSNAEAVPWIAKLPDGNDSYRERYTEIHDIRNRMDSAINKCVVNHPDREMVVDNMGEVIKSLEKKAHGKTDWKSLFSAQTKKIVAGFSANEHKPQTPEEWGYVLDFSKWLASSREFVAKWNATVAAQIDNIDARAPALSGIDKWLRKTDKAITGAKSAKDLVGEVQSQLADMFADAVVLENAAESDVRKIMQDIKDNLTKIKCEQSREKIKAQEEKMGDAEIGDAMRTFLNSDDMGSPNIDGQAIMRQWDKLISEAKRLCDKVNDFAVVSRITALIEDEGATEWANTLRRQSSRNDENNAMPTNWREAWLWGCANAWLDSIESGEKIRTLMAKLRETETSRKKALGNIVEWRAKKCLKDSLRRNENAARALRSFATLVKNAPKGTTAKTAPIFQKSKAAALKKCYEVIPCWIMPSWRANEMLPAELGSFDLVIMDEASQSDVKELLTLMRGKKVLVVGDEEQVSPTVFVAVGNAQNLIDKHLLPIPLYVRDLLRPGGSLYNIALTIFPNQSLMLTEHFRCAEPIISFSSRKFYNDNIIPLRVPKSTERITPPLVDVYVRDGVRVGYKNEAEANAIVDEIVDVWHNSGRSIGVISLVGHVQARHINDLLNLRLGLGHGVKCGNAASFQGSEYDIVFLSMVDVPGGAAWTKREVKQRFNVAASRARDRLYLYRSIRKQYLHNSNDMKLRLIEHFENPMPDAGRKSLRELCESAFERNVFDRLIDCGYAAIPQVGSVGYRIDIVVEGENGNRIAVELDGDKYHGEQNWDKDFARQQTLERVGWHFWRCFASTYERDKDGTFQNLRDELASHGIEPWQQDTDMTKFVEHREINGMPESNAENAEYASNDGSDTDNTPEENEGAYGIVEDNGNDSGEGSPFSLKHQPTTNKLL